MENLNMQRGSVSWPIIIILFFLFFPIGIYLLINKVIVEKGFYRQNARVMSNFGTVFVVLGIIYWIIYYIIGGTGGLVIDGVDNSAPLIFIIILFFGGGMLLLISARRIRKRGERFERYQAIINSHQNGSLDDIASAVPDRYEVVCKELQKMIDIGFFPNAYINLDKRKFISPQFNFNNYESIQPVSSVEITQQLSCSNCGAINTISNSVLECEYCGTSL